MFFIFHLDMVLPRSRQCRTSTQGKNLRSVSSKNVMCTRTGADVATRSTRLTSVEKTEFLAKDPDRTRIFKCATWTPHEVEPHALILFSHHSGGSRLSAQYLCNHLASNGYAVAALDHSDAQLPRPSEAATENERERRLNAWIAARVPDIRFLLRTVGGNARRVGIVGHSFGGWTALAAPTHEPRIGAVVALAPAGATNPRPGIIRATLDFQWKRKVPTLVIAAERDVSIPLAQIRDVFDRIPSPKRLLTLSSADHLHFVDDAARQHERMRTMQFPPELSWLQREIRPFSELLPEDEAHAMIADSVLAHFDAIYLQSSDSQENG